MNYKAGVYDQVFGLRVVVSDLLPIVPTDGENARRLVRHGLKKALPWLDIDPGPEPFKAVEMMIATDPILVLPVLYVSREVYYALKREALAGNSQTIEKVWRTRDEWTRLRYGI